MKRKNSFISENVVEFTLIDASSSIDVGNWKITSEELEFTDTVPFSIEKRRLCGGKQAGVDILIIDNGQMVITLIPTRGMGVFDVKMGGQRVLGWNSPVKEIVNPAFINLESRGRTGWLDGFNEVIARCGYEWTGHPGVDDNGHHLTLHGRIQNTPASTVKVIIEKTAPYKISVQGEVSERTFKMAELVTLTEFEVTPGTTTFSLHDRLTNEADYDHEYQIIYHANFGTPILEEGAKFVTAAREVAPFDNASISGLEDWQTYLGPTKNFGEMLFTLKPIGDEQGNTLAVLHNAKGSLGVAVGYNIKQLPALTLWKNTDTQKQGYVTGIEPGSSYPYNAKYQRPLGLIPIIKAGETKEFDMTYTVLTSQNCVQEALQKVDLIQKGERVKQVVQPIVDLNR